MAMKRKSTQQDSDDLFANTGKAITNYELEITNGKSNNSKSENQNIQSSDKSVIRNSQFVISNSPTPPPPISNSSMSIPNSWLTNIPKHWEVKRLKHIASLKSGESITAEEIEANSEYPVYGGNGLRGFYTNFTHDGHFVLIGRQGALCGNINYAKGKFWASEHAVVVTPISKVATLWLGELLRSMNLNQYSVSAAQPGLSIDKIKDLIIPVPPLPEQKAIAEFLDQKTNKIDSLISKKKKLVELLKEKRGALISAAVTGKMIITNYELEITNDKSNNPKYENHNSDKFVSHNSDSVIDNNIRNSQFVISNSVRRKSSGIEWLGDIPQHWEVKKGKYIGVLQSTPNVSEEEQSEVNGDLFYIKVEDLNTPVNQVYFTKPAVYCINDKKPYVNNALIFPKRGAAIFTNKVSILTNKALLDPNMMGWEIKDSLEIKFYYYALIARRLNDLADTSTVPQINNKHIYPEAFPFPPPSEQKAIAEFLDRETGKIDALISKVEQAIEKLKEYRSALISAAVTGKIDPQITQIDTDRKSKHE